MNQRRGKVYLVGAGPGDPDLITVRGMRLIERADTIIYDRLIPSEVLSWAPVKAKLIDVGKFPDHHRITQAEINELLVQYGSRGDQVVRLKGGDPFVFGRATEELAVCRAAGIDCEVVPGVSSCIAGPASVGIPVTSRGVARSFTVLTGHTDPKLGKHNFDFQALAKMETLVLMMARGSLGFIAQSLIDAGMDPTTPVASIERATQTDQRAVAGPLHDIAAAVEAAGMQSPMITVVGHVASQMDASLMQVVERVSDQVG